MNTSASLSRPLRPVAWTGSASQNRAALSSNIAEGLDLNNIRNTHPWSFTACRKDLKHCHRRKRNRTEPIQTKMEKPILQEARKNIPDPPPLILLVLEVRRHFRKVFFLLLQAPANDWLTLLPAERKPRKLKSLVAFNRHYNKQNRILSYRSRAGIFLDYCPDKPHTFEGGFLHIIQEL